MAAFFPKIYDILSENPHKKATLGLTLKKEVSETLWDSFEVTTLQPPGTTSFALWLTDPMYRLGTPLLRRQLLRDSILELEKRVDSELSGRAWPRKKIHEAFARELGTNPNPTEPLLEEACAELLGYQKIVLSREKKTIAFFPKDIRTWRRDVPLFFSDSDNHWILVPTQPWNLQKFGIWLGEKEADDWTISWPISDAKLEELRSELEKRGIGITTNNGRKLLKEELAKKVGRAQALSVLAAGSSAEAQI